MKKRWIAGIVGVAMMGTLLTGCAGNKEEHSLWMTNEAQDTRNDTQDATDGAQDATNATRSGVSTADQTKSVNGAEGEDTDIMYEDVWVSEEAACESVTTDMEMRMYDGYIEMVPEESMYANPYGNEEYGEIIENEFLSVKEQPLSTFSADVDTASYSNVRRMIQDGYELDWIPKDSVRLEEMINYFDYDYDGPRAGEPFGVNTEIATCPWNEDSYLMMVGLQTEEVDFSEAAPSNLVFLIDVSGSMYDEDKLPLLQQSFAMLSSNLTAKDRVSIVTYAGDDQIVLQGAKGSDTDVIVQALERLTASGSTNGSAGILTAYELAQEYFIPGGNNRVILATDGDLNVGLTSEEDLEEMITKQKESGVFLSVLGFGTGNIKDSKMELLADKGNGNYAYIDSLSEARKVLVEEMGATLVTVAKDVKFQMEFDPEMVSEYRLIGYENRALENEDFTDDTKDAGEIGAGHCVTVLYEIKLTKEAETLGMFRDFSTLHIRYKEPEADESRQLDYAIGTDSIKNRASEDLLFAGCVAQFGMLLRDSEYQGDTSYRSILECLGTLECVKQDEYKAEFAGLVEQVLRMDGVVVCY